MCWFSLSVSEVGVQEWVDEDEVVEIEESVEDEMWLE
jgi:hypothetical protein